MKRLKTLLGINLKGLTLFEKLWLLAPIFIWFSYQPLLRIGQNDTMYFELSLALIYVSVLALAGVPVLWRYRRQLLRRKAALVALALIILAGVSLWWTPNLTRGILTLGVAGLLTVVFLASLATFDRFKQLLPALAKVLIASAVVMSLLAIVQAFAGIWLSREAALLCAGCTASQFGFVRPNVFTIEPQFFGNMLIAPALLGAWLLIKERQRWFVTAGVAVIFTALFLTMSRGAIFALGIGVVLLLLLNVKRLRGFGRAIIILVVAFAACLLLQGFTAAINPNINESFGGAVAKSLNQLSLGVIDIKVAEPAPAAPSDEKTPNYDGYVEESTDTRVNLTNMALETWSSDPARLFFGVGLGGSGVALRDQFPGEIGAREIVQNEYVERLLETGLVGLALFAGLLGMLVYVLVRGHAWWAVAIIVALAVQWNFFSGYPNALHIYLSLIGLAMFALTAHRGRSAPATQY